MRGYFPFHPLFLLYLIDFLQFELTLYIHHFHFHHQSYFHLYPVFALLCMFLLCLLFQVLVWLIPRLFDYEVQNFRFLLNLYSLVLPSALFLVLIYLRQFLFHPTDHASL
uniref:Transmembrane protein n=1 Tax=Cacopsylla melanoneura TaxID=428564 RepID=A0A8D8YB41_9HEMI